MRPHEDWPGLHSAMTTVNGAGGGEGGGTLCCSLTPHICQRLLRFPRSVHAWVTLKEGVHSCAHLHVNLWVENNIHHCKKKTKKSKKNLISSW